VSEDIKQGDWIFFASSTGRKIGKVIEVDSEGYDVSVPLSGGGARTTVVAKGPKVKKVPLPAKD
jgi:hypothetical protein